MKKSKLNEILRYLSCAVIITVINWGSYSLFVNKLGFAVFWGNLTSWILANISAFFVNKLWVFQSYTWKKTDLTKEIVSFFSARVFSGAVEIIGVPILEKLSFDMIFYSLLTKLGVTASVLFTDGIYSKIGIGAIILVLNYVLSKVFVFKNTEKNRSDAAQNESFS